jgi:hypothetical protein
LLVSHSRHFALAASRKSAARENSKELAGPGKLGYEECRCMIIMG